MFVLIAVGLFVACSAQVPVPCQSPKQWEGKRTLVDRSKQFAEIARVYYDEENNRIRVVEEVEQGKEKAFYDTLYLHNIGKEYRTDLRTKKCNVSDLTRPLRPIGVPPTAKFLFESEVGAAQVPGEHLTVVAFGGNYTQDDVQYMTTVTYPSCIPVSDFYYNDVTKYVESHYFDIHGGITDPMAFIPPTMCTY